MSLAFQQIGKTMPLMTSICEGIGEKENLPIK